MMGKIVNVIKNLLKGSSKKQESVKTTLMIFF
jgi:hypothetical protein